jgi:hypothetical protein
VQMGPECLGLIVVTVRAPEACTTQEIERRYMRLGICQRKGGHCHEQSTAETPRTAGKGYELENTTNESPMG